MNKGQNTESKGLNDIVGNTVNKVWKDCPDEGCKNKVCLALNSDKCFTHSKGIEQWKLLKITLRNIFFLNFTYKKS